LSAIEGNTQIIQQIIEHSSVLDCRVPKGTYKNHTALDLAILNKKKQASLLLHQHGVPTLALEFPPEWQ
jgi:hypothetical protein